MPSKHRIDLPILKGKVDYQAERAIQILKARLEELNQSHDTLLKLVQSLPPQLSLAQIRDALSPTGPFALPSASLLNTNPPQTAPVTPPPTPPPPLPPAPPSQVDYVTQAKADLIAAGIDVATFPCGFFEVTKLVAWRLKLVDTNPAVGLEAYAGASNCDGYSPDILLFNNGRSVDIIRADGTPQWLVNDGLGNISDWRAPITPSIPE